MAAFDASQRRVCERSGVAPASYRYRARKRDAELRSRLVALAQDKPRYWYRWLGVLLQREKCV